MVESDNAFHTNQNVKTYGESILFNAKINGTIAKN